MKIDLTKLSNEWNEITKFNHLRNHLVHTSNKYLNDDIGKRRLNSIKEIRKGLIVDSNKIYFENDESIKHFIRICKKFIQEIYFIKQ